MLLEKAYFPTFTNPLSFHRLLAREQVVIDRILRHAWVRVFLMNSIAPHARLSFSAALLPWNSIKVQVTIYVTSASLRHLISHNFMAFQMRTVESFVQNRCQIDWTLVPVLRHQKSQLAFTFGNIKFLLYLNFPRTPTHHVGGGFVVVAKCTTRNFDIWSSYRYCLCGKVVFIRWWDPAAKRMWRHFKNFKSIFPEL